MTLTADTTAAVRERPILFSGPMVRAILDGSKTMTRRVVKPQPDNPETFGISPVWGYGVHSKGEHAGHYCVHAATNVGGRRVDRFIRSPYGKPGDRLWVRETWFGNYPGGDEPETFHYAATEDFSINGRSVWRSGIIMPRKASRLTLEITDVRVERLQAISEDDACDEGLEGIVNDPALDGYGEWSKPDVITAREQFRELWDSINAKRHGGSCAWKNNPWVWVIAFRRLDSTTADQQRSAGVPEVTSACASLVNGMDE